MRHFLNAVEAADVVECVDARRETSMEAEDLVIDEGSEWEIVEEVGEELPDVCIAIFAQALVVEAVHLCNLSGLVVTAKDGDSGGVSNLEGNEEGNGFDGVVASINVVACVSGQFSGDYGEALWKYRHTHEEVVCVWIWSADSEELHEIMELAMDISTDCHGAFLGTVVSQGQVAGLNAAYHRLDIGLVL